MSTRSCIARRTGETTFAGVYHHWDGYPSGLGATLFDLYRDVFERDLPRMLHVLIDEHPAGWSTLNGKNWSFSPGYVERDHVGICTCGAQYWRHYAQEYKYHGLPEPEHPANDFRVLGHSFERVPQTGDDRPVCFCHGDRSEEPNEITEKNAADCGCEYAYVFTEDRRMLVLSSYHPDGTKMVGMFGCGDPESSWRVIATVDLDKDAPDWERIEA